MNFYSIKKTDANTKARIGELKTKHGTVKTPVFLPIGTKATVKGLTSHELLDTGASMILSNTYHLWMSPGDTLIANAGGIHNFMNWNGPIFTDSGGFQIFSLGQRSFKSNNLDSQNELPFNVKVSEEGVTFQKGNNGQKMFLTPEKSVQIQNNLGSDIAVVLDEFTGDIYNYEKVRKTVERTTKWARRSRDELQLLRTEDRQINDGQLQLGIVQGGMIETLREQSSREISKLGFDGYAIGGVAVSGESSDMQYKAVDMSLPYLEEDKFKHLLGVGTPEQIIQSVARGIDSFDCVIPTREARHGRLYVKQESGYTTLDITKSMYADDFSTVDSTCDCYCCKNHTKAYLNHLFRSNEILGLRFASQHNLKFYLFLMEKIREAIEQNTLNILIQNYTND